MGYIYCITNLINGKQYIGKTQLSINERFKEHCRASRKEYGNRPLYDAMNKYGIENFNIRQLEQVEDETKLDEREIYWIQELKTYGSNGYNATKGGDGKILYDYKELVELYNLGYTPTQISQKTSCNLSSVYRILKAQGIKFKNRSKSIDQYDMAGNYIQTFNTVREAKLWLVDRGLAPNSNSTNKLINMVAGKENKSAYKYRWKYHNK